MLNNYDPYVIAGPTQGGQFPPGLNTADPPTDLRADESPDCYGLDLTKEGRIAVGTIPTGTARIARTFAATAWANNTAYAINDVVTSGAATYLCKTAHTSIVSPGVFATDAANWTAATFYQFYNRLWRMVTDASTYGHYLWYGAPNYDDTLYEQDFSRLMLENNGAAGGPVAICAFGSDSIAVGFAVGGYIVSNCADNRGYFQRSDINQQLGCASMNRMTTLDGLLVVSNAGGLIGFDGNKTVELTAAVRNDLTNFASTDLTVDYQKHWIIGGTSFVYDITAKKVYRWSGTDFRFTSRQFHAPDYSPMVVDRLVFHVEHADDQYGSFAYEIKREDGAWEDAVTINCQYTDERYSVITEDLATVTSSRRFQVRLSALTANLYIKEIRVDAAAFRFDGYSV